MRNHAIAKIIELASTDSRIMVINADLGYNVLNVFEQRFPNRYINVGISEQNMTSVAAGMALEGNMVFTYSIGNFPTLRCIEQIRNNICYHDANVKILSVGGGFAYGDLGMTHHATEDIAMMRALPNMKVFVPADAIEAEVCVETVCSFDGPSFVRMARGGEPVLRNEKPQNIYRLQSINRVEGRDVNILTCGTILSEGIVLAERLQRDGISAGLFSVPCIKPIDREYLQYLARNSKLIITIEEHNIIGGLGGAVAEVVSEITDKHAALKRFGLQDVYTSKVGDQTYLRQHYGMSAQAIYDYIIKNREVLL